MAPTVRQIQTTHAGRTPDDFQTGFWPYDEKGGRGTVVRARSLAWAFPKQKDHRHMLFHFWWIRPEGEDKIVGPIRWKQGWLPQFDKDDPNRLLRGHVPTKETNPSVQYPTPACPDDFNGDIWDVYQKLGDPADPEALILEDHEVEDWAGYLVTGVGALPKMDFTQLVESLKDAGYKDFPIQDYRQFEGLDVFMLRVKSKYGQDNKKKAATDAATGAAGGPGGGPGGEAPAAPKDWECLVVTDIYNLDKDGKLDKDAMKGQGQTEANTTPGAGGVTVDPSTVAGAGSTKKKKDKKKNGADPELVNALRETLYRLVTEEEDEVMDTTPLANEALLAHKGQEALVFPLLVGNDSDQFWSSMTLIEKERDPKGNLTGRVVLTAEGRKRYESEP